MFKKKNNCGTLLYNVSKSCFICISSIYSCLWQKEEAPIIAIIQATSSWPESEVLNIFVF